MAFVAPHRARADDVPIPDVVGPIPVTATSHPFNSMYYATVPIDLSALRYVEEEYFVSGDANVYQWNDKDFELQVESSSSYTTRILVIRPTKPNHFSGNVIVEPLHTSGGGSPVIWGYVHDYLIASGDAYILITQPTTIPTHKVWDPDRYDSLSVPDVLCPSSSPVPEKGLLWDFISQVGALLKSGSPSNPLSEFDVEYLYATGFSQTGTIITTYVNFIHPVARLGNGDPIYDGYVIGGAGSPATINQCASRLPQDDPRSIIQPSGVPVFRVMTQADFNLGSWFSTRRPDSDTYPDLFRLYEVPGATHFTQYPRLSYPNADELAPIGLTPTVIVCTPPAQPTSFPYHYILNGTFANLDRWVREGELPPRGDLIAANNAGTPVLDEFDNAVGGVRTPYVDVPIVTYYPTMNPFVNCETPFSDELLEELYPTHGRYVGEVIHYTKKLRKNRWVTGADAQKIRTEAAHADVP
jgi:hypothetical protein